MTGEGGKARPHPKEGSKKSLTTNTLVITYYAYPAHHTQLYMYYYNILQLKLYAYKIWDILH